MIRGRVVTEGAKWFHHLTERISDSTRGGFAFVCPTHAWPQRGGAGKLMERLEGRTFDSREGVQDLETLRTHFEPIEVFRRRRIVDDFVYDFERQPGEETRIATRDSTFC